ncbi:MAG: carboxypeptidase regulatory-like domain-containing protein [Bryobacteraceae bacterium]
MADLMKCILGLVFVVFCVSPCVSAQNANGAVNGTVTDPSGASVPEVDVVLMNVATNIQAAAPTNADGVYAFMTIPPGQYVLNVHKEGFQTVHVSAFTVSVNQTVTQNVNLAIGNVAESVSVTAQAPLVQASTSELGTVISEKAIERLPMNGRNFTQMILLTPGVTPVNTAQEWGSTVALPGSTWVKPSVNGQWNRSNVYLMDGIINAEGETSGYNVLPSLDAIQEFKVQSHNDKGEYGLVMGGIVNLLTKSGTNEFHGSAFEFLRNEAFNARDPFHDILPGQGPAVFRQNQFGATAGGPVYIPRIYNGKNKTFFFFSYDGWRYRLAQKSLYRVPTAAELQGDFSGWPQAIYDPTTTHADPNNPQQLIRDVFPGNIIPGNRLSSMMVNTLRAFYDTPNIGLNVDGYDNVLNNRPNQNDENGFQVRIDHQISSKSNLFARYNHLNVASLTPDSLKNGGFDIHTPEQVAAGWNQIFTPTVLLSTQFGYSSAPWNRRPEHPFTVQQLADLGWSQISKFGGQVLLGIDQIGPTGIEGDPYSVVSQHQYQLSQDLSWVKANHQLKFGWLMFRQSWGGSDPYVGADFAPDQTADPQQTGGVVSGIGLASALLGLPQDVYAGNEQYNQRYFTWGFYGQDEWKVSRNLTLNLSLRWEFANPPTYYKFTPGTFDIASGDYLIGGKTMPPACTTSGAAPCIPGDGSLSSIPGGDHIRLADRPNIRYPHRNNLEPRLGLAWKILPRTVVRAGAGLVYDVFSGITQENNNIQFRWPNAGFAAGQYNMLGEPLTTITAAEGANLSPFPDLTPWYTLDSSFDPRKKPAYSVQYNFEVQHQFTDKLMSSVAYSGSVTRRLDFGYPVNAAVTPEAGTSDEVNLRRPYPYIPTAFYYSVAAGRSNYNSMQVQLNRRFSDGAMVMVAYTWSKVMDNGNSGWFGAENGPSGSSSIQDTYHLNTNHSVAAYDIPHNLWISGTWEPPFGKGKRWLQTGPLSWVLGNWRADFIQSVRSGQPWNPMINGDLANVGRYDTYMRPNLTGDPTPEHRSASMWVNPAAFSIPQFAFGNVGRNSFRTEAVFSTDLAMVKGFHLAERLRAELRAEAFNLFNVMNYGAPNAALDQPDFGVITTLAPNQYPRQFQFGARLSF